MLEEIFLDVASILDTSISVTSSDSIGTFSELLSEINDAISVSSLDNDNMETSESLIDQDEVSSDNDNICTSTLLIEHINDDENSSDNDNSSTNDGNNDLNDEFDFPNYNNFFDDLSPHLRSFNQFILPYYTHDVKFQFSYNYPQ